MPFFKELPDVTDPKKYPDELKAALKLCNGKKFLYFANHPKCPKRLHVLLVDFDAGVVKLLGGTAKGEGKVWVEKGEGEKEQLRFEVAKGAMKIRPLKKYVEVFYKTRTIMVPADEPEDGAEGVEVESTEPGAPSTGEPGQMPPLPTPPTGQEPPKPQPQAESKPPQTPLPQPPVDPARQKQEAELRARMEALRKQPVDKPMEQMKTQVLEKAELLVKGGRFPDATLLLDQYVKKAAAPMTPAPPVAPKPEASKPSTPAPKLSAYMGATKRWKDAKATAANGVFALKTAILKECDPELKKAVEAKINSLNSIMDVMDDKIITKIEDAGREADEERQAERNQELAKFANNILAALGQHPLADVVDNNPFGAFTIRGPVESVLTKFATDFGG